MTHPDADLGASTVDTEPDPPASAPERGRRARRREWPLLLALSLLIAFGVRTFLVQAFYIPSGSMEQTLHGCPGCHNNDRVLVDKVSYRFRAPERGEIVVFDGRGSFTQQAQQKDFIKRVIGLPGDTVECCDDAGHVVVNGHPLAEPYLFEDDAREFAPVTVPAGRLFVMGDHRCCSDDSRVKGTVPIDRVVGRAFATVWPPSRVGGLE